MAHQNILAGVVFVFVVLYFLMRGSFSPSLHRLSASLHVILRSSSKAYPPLLSYIIIFPLYPCLLPYIIIFLPMHLSCPISLFSSPISHRVLFLTASIYHAWFLHSSPLYIHLNATHAVLPELPCPAHGQYWEKERMRRGYNEGD